MNPRDRLASIETELRSIHDAAGDQGLDTETQTRWDALVSERETVTEAIRADDRRRDVIRSLADRGVGVEGGDGADAAIRRGPEVMIRRDPFEILETRGRDLDGRAFGSQAIDSCIRAVEDCDITPENRAHYERTLRRHLSGRRTVRLDDSTRAWALNLVARSHPDYETGFAKLMMGRPETLTSEERAAIAVGTNTQGGYLVPTHLDPTLILTNSGSSNAIRGISRVVTLVNGNVWHGVTTAGVTASWDGELAEVSDDSPSVGTAAISTIMAQGFVQASISAFEDIAGLTSDVMMLFADARDRLEGAAHATGSGSGAPKGIFTACAASSGVLVTSTTAATIGEVDIHAVYRAVPVRFRGNASWVANPLYTLAVKRLGTAVSSSFSGDLTMPVSDRWLGRPVVETDDGPTTQTTTALDNEIVLGDFSNYVIVDKPGSMSVEFIPHLFNTNANLPDGRRGWYAYWRSGADAANLAAFRMLVDKTSA